MQAGGALPQGTHVRDDRNDKRTHRFDVSRAAFDAAINPDPLILLTDQVLMTHRSPYPLVNRIRLLN
jgi:hypothetical protein